MLRDVSRISQTLAYKSHAESLAAEDDSDTAAELILAGASVVISRL